MQAAQLADGDMLLAVIGPYLKASSILGRLRLEVGRMLELADPNCLEFAWVNNFPLFEYDEDRGALTPSHHLFSMPFEEHIPLLDSDPLKVRAHLYRPGVQRYRVGVRIDPSAQSCAARKDHGRRGPHQRRCSAPLRLSARRARVRRRRRTAASRPVSTASS